jgi:isoleucyl-tRNA synthetase
MMRTLNVPRTLGQCRHIRLQSSSYPFPFTRYYATSANTQSDPNKKYSNTLLLPKTDFPVRHKVPVEVERRLRSRTADELYRSQVGQTELRRG